MRMEGIYVPEFWQIILLSVVVSGVISTIVTGYINWYFKKVKNDLKKGGLLLKNCTKKWLIWI